MNKFVITARRFVMNINARLTMNDEVQIPVFGLGVYLNTEGPQCVSTIKFALDNGYRHIDTAEFYGNEESVGQAVISSGLAREDVFITSKVWSTKGGRTDTIRTCSEAVKRANIGYFDLYLIHAPQGGHVQECYEALHELKSRGIVRSVGVSNFGVEHLKALQLKALPKPSNNQIELHPWQQKRDIVEYCRKEGISLTAYSPLTKGQRINDPVITSIARQLGKTNAQILIKWALQNNFITIPKSSNKERILENMQVFDWLIPDADMRTLNALGDKPWSCTWDPTRNSLREAGL
ncbi:hypothetical protein GJ496_012070 [Pomphorhynchus laevis]|nr:hypothetical protein GJ496_012070 [Pomphorhynchus laevis]